MRPREALRLDRAILLRAVADLEVEALRRRRVVALIAGVRIVDLQIRSRIRAAGELTLLELREHLDVVEALKAERDVTDRHATLSRHWTRGVVRIAAADDRVAAIVADPRLVLAAFVTRWLPAEERLIPRDALLV